MSPVWIVSKPQRWKHRAVGSKTCARTHQREVLDDIVHMSNLSELVNRVPITTPSTGGRYCSIITVDVGNAFVSERRIARTATATRGIDSDQSVT